MTRAAPIVLATLFLIAAIMLGGAASAGAYANAVVQIAAASGIALALVTRGRYPAGTQRGLVVLLVAALALAIVQLVPLPPSIWTALPGRAIVADSYALAGITPGWRPISMTPEATTGAALAMLPVIAAALIGMRMPRIGLMVLFGTIVAIMLGSVVLGLAQRMTGLDSPFYIYTITNRGEGVGLFANSNHLGTLCALSIPVATAMFVAQRGSTRPDARWLMLGAILVFALFGVGVSNSMAGIALAMVALLSVYMIARLRRDTGKVRLGIAAVILSAVLAIGVLASIMLWSHIGDGTLARGGEMGRAMLWQRTIRGIVATMPFGSGLGGFASVYPQFEDAATATIVFANHAHNDYLEAMMTGGIPALILMLGFGAWWLRTAATIWTAATRDALSEAATVVTGLILMHELVDYPIRTAAIGVIFGLCCGVMARPRRIVEPADDAPRATRHLSA